VTPAAPAPQPTPFRSHSERQPDRAERLAFDSENRLAADAIARAIGARDATAAVAHLCFTSHFPRIFASLYTEGTDRFEQPNLVLRVRAKIEHLLEVEGIRLPSRLHRTVEQRVEIWASGREVHAAFPKIFFRIASTLARS